MNENDPYKVYVEEGEKPHHCTVCKCPECRKKMKRLYICWFRDEPVIVGIVANSNKEAKEIFYNKYHDKNLGCTKMTDIRTHLSKTEVDVSNVQIGEVSQEWGIKHDIYLDDYNF